MLFDIDFDKFAKNIESFLDSRTIGYSYAIYQDEKLMIFGENGWV
jgi:hypothetical protein